MSRGRKNLIAFLLIVLLSLAVRCGDCAEVSLAWNPSVTSTVTGYKVYWGPSSRNYEHAQDAGNQTTWTVVALEPGTYFFAVTAYDPDTESGYSNEVSAFIDSEEPPPEPVIFEITSHPVSVDWYGATLLAMTNKPASAYVRYRKMGVEGEPWKTIIASPTPVGLMHRAVIYDLPMDELAYYEYIWSITSADGEELTTNGTFYVDGL